jgi:enoyl-CoA hydratase
LAPATAARYRPTIRPPMSGESARETIRMADSDTYENVRYDVRDGVAFVVVSRPKALNALNDRTLDELERVFATIRTDAAVKAVVVTGDGEKAFVAGADISELAKMTPAEAKTASAKGQRVFGRVEDCGKLVVAAVNGFALGGGLELALACHVRFASPEAKLGLPEVTLGLIPGYGGTQRLARLVGPGLAIEMIASGDMIDAAAAERIGLVNRVVPRTELLGAAEAFARRVASRAPLAVRHAIHLTVLTAPEDVGSDGLFRERERFAKCFETSDMREGTQAFLEKRKPTFKGI